MDFSTARKNMVETQLMPNKITVNEINERFLTVPREFFVQPSDVSIAYSDGFAFVGNGREMLPPMIQARLLQELDIKPENKLMIIASGSGYSSVIASPLCAHIWCVEEETSLRDIARKGATTSMCSNISIKSGKPEEGRIKEAPFDRILIDVPVGFIPQKIIKQLANGGKLIAVVENDNGVLEATKFTKSGKTVITEFLFNTNGRILPNFAKESKFVF